MLVEIFDDEPLGRPEPSKKRSNPSKKYSQKPDQDHALEADREERDEPVKPRVLGRLSSLFCEGESRREHKENGWEKSWELCGSADLQRETP